jgi:hypothetical protein
MVYLNAREASMIFSPCTILSKSDSTKNKMPISAGYKGRQKTPFNESSDLFTHHFKRFKRVQDI